MEIKTYMAIWLGYYELSLLLVLVFQFLRGTFCCFHARLFGLKNAGVFSKCFPSNISFGILKLFVFPAVAHILGKELVEEKPSEVLTVYISSAPLCKFKRVGLTKSNQQLLAKRKHDSIGIASNMLSLNNNSRC